LNVHVGSDPWDIRVELTAGQQPHYVTPFENEEGEIDYGQDSDYDEFEDDVHPGYNPVTRYATSSTSKEIAELDLMNDKFESWNKANGESFDLPRFETLTSMIEQMSEEYDMDATPDTLDEFLEWRSHDLKMGYDDLDGLKKKFAEHMESRQALKTILDETNREHDAMVLVLQNNGFESREIEFLGNVDAYDDCYGWDYEY
jgi:hypothetical protein